MKFAVLLVCTISTVCLLHCSLAASNVTVVSVSDVNTKKLVNTKQVSLYDEGQEDRFEPYLRDLPIAIKKFQEQQQLSHDPPVPRAERPIFGYFPPAPQQQEGPSNSQEEPSKSGDPSPYDQPYYDELIQPGLKDSSSTHYDQQYYQQFTQPDVIDHQQQYEQQYYEGFNGPLDQHNTQKPYEQQYYEQFNQPDKQEPAASSKDGLFNHFSKKQPGAEDSKRQHGTADKKKPSESYSKQFYGYSSTGGSDDPDCPQGPNPQTADSVTQVYIKHATFNWHDLAAKLQPKPGSDYAEDENDPAYTKLQLSHIRPKQKAKLQQHKQHKQRLQQQQQQPPNQNQTMLIQGHNATVVNSSTMQQLPIAEPSSKQVAHAAGSVTPSAVTHPKFLLPVGDTISGRGFEGTYDRFIPTAEALAVGPHHSNPAFVTVLHGVNKMFEIFTVTKHGMLVGSAQPSKISMDVLIALTGASDCIIPNLPNAWYDFQEERYGLAWVSFSNQGSVSPRTFIAVSHTRDPGGDWTIWMLDAMLPTAPGSAVCSSVTEYTPDYPQVSFSDNGLFIALGVFCGDNFLSVLTAYSKTTLYNPAPGEDPEVYVAAYFGPMSWYRSLPLHAQLAVDEDYKPFNNFITPTRPQAVEDVNMCPAFVMKVDNRLLSLATLTNDDLEAMTSVDTAPKILAVLVEKGADFGSRGEEPECAPAMPQYGTNLTLYSGDTGMVGRTFAVRSYGAIHHAGLLYLTTSEFFGARADRTPSIYWGIFSPRGPHDPTCPMAVDLVDWGVISSADGLALGYPVIAAREEGGALVAYSYSGGGFLPHEMGPAFPGVATTVVGASILPPDSIDIATHNTNRKQQKSSPQKPKAATTQKVRQPTKILGKRHAPEPYPDPEPQPYGMQSTIDIAKLGTASVVRGVHGVPSQPWGPYSAMQVYEGRVWFAVPIAGQVSLGESFRRAWRSWVGVESLWERRED